MNATPSWLQIDNAVRIAVMALHLSGGSVGEINLYQLLQTYLLDEEKRRAINRVVAS
jgi:hypothetical protein